MRFQSDRRTSPSLLSRRDQSRLLVMVAALGVMIFAVQWAARPGSWHWLLPSAADGRTADPALEDIDFRVKQAVSPSLAPDSFLAVESAPVSDNDSADAHKLVEGASEEIPKEILAPIEDNTLGLRRKEADAYRWMLTRVRELPEATAAGQARDDVAFTVLMLHPDEYRGQLLSVQGELRRLTALPGRQANGFETLYEGWLFTRDSGTNPYRIVCTQIPDGVAPGESLDPPLAVRVVGYFFKRYGYASQGGGGGGGGQHVAPMLIAKSFQLMPQAVRGPVDGPGLRYALLGWMAAILFGAVMAGVWFAMSDRRFRRSRLHALAAGRMNAAPHELGELRNVESIDPEHLFPSKPTTVDSEVSSAQASSSSAGR